MPLAPPVMSTPLLSRSRFIALRFQAVESGGIVAEDRRLLIGWPADQIGGDQIQNLTVASREKAHRPVGTKHQALGSEGFKDDIEIGFEIARLPMLPVGFVDQAGELTEDVRSDGKLAHQASPRLQLARLDLGLAEVIDDKGLPRMRGDELEHGGKMFRINQDVIGEAELGKAGDAALEVGAKHETLVGLALNEVAEAAQLFERPPLRESIGNIGRAEIDPADDSQDGGMIPGQVEEKPGFLLGGIRLHRDGGVDAGGMD